MKEKEATEAAGHSRTIGLAGGASTRTARDMATVSNRVVIGPRPQGVPIRGGGEEEMADVDEDKEAPLDG